MSLPSQCFWFTNGKAKCFGYNGYGACGQNATTFTSQKNIHMNSQMGDNLPFIALDNKGLVLVSSLSAVSEHTCAITYTGTKMPAAGKVKCWGDNEYFKLGVLNSTQHVGTEPGQMGDALPYVDLGTGQLAKQVVAGRDSTCVVLASGKVKCWGFAYYGELGQGNQYGYTGTPGNMYAMGDALPYVNLGTGVLVKQLVAGDADYCMIASAPSTHVGGLK